MIHRRWSQSAAALLLVVCSVAATAQQRDAVSTRCREVEVALDANHSASRLERCGEEGAPDLLWHLDRIDQVSGALDGSYHRRHGGAGSVVYVMDTGILAAHDEFESNGGTRVIAGYDVTESVIVGNSSCQSGNKAMSPCYATLAELGGASHGTSVASLVAGKSVGVAPDASVISIRVMNESALATTRTYLEGLNAIIKSAWDPSTPQFHTAVVNISGWVLERLVGNPDQAAVPFASVERKIREMINGVDAQGRPDQIFGKRFLFVVAANNVDNGCGRAGVVDRFPAILGRDTDGLITVGGMTATNSWWAGGCRGGVEILAPSQSIFSASISSTDHYRGSRPNLRSGTSFAAPIISGIAARLLAEDSTLTPQELERIIVSTPARIFNPDPLHADGRVAFVRDAAPMMTARAAGDLTARLAP